MKKTINILLLLSLLVSAAACSGPVTDPEDVTGDEEETEQPTGPAVSQRPGADFVSQFEKHVALWEFTGAWCANCPSGYTNMNFVLTANPDFTDYVHPMAFHSNTNDTDDLAIKETDAIMSAMNVTSLGFPSYAVDMTYGGSLVEGVNLREHLYDTFEDNAPFCGVAVSSNVTDGVADVALKLYTELDASWRVAVYVVEDKVKYYQKDGMREHDQYTHRHVVRQIVSASYLGDRIGDKITAAGTELTADYEISVSSDWNLENTYVYVLAIDALGYVNNMNFCAITDGNSDYNRVK